ncbi:nucleotide pyrophosphatase/phosphodiesterase family protein [Kineosporia sp. NBRC 101731]|uniref:nucleotide pyrophosphatase/phosphodiesterase family protein n=1 Tax=Kineosporia sp. NBRC 101731 TaxID=3032199 RepID=UPI0024A3EB59|nr:nucleotide pyrophosphatase/phosphodiesterase family protein [Kineosporia sp. NBRC 101731]GLY31308.1 alkaline phosphatase family protein [Kineosporia sp. NBRC 101731]
MNPVLVVNIVGLTPRLLRHMPRVASTGFRANLGTVLPALTCSAQATYLTGKLPSEHGIVGNGWYFRDQGEVYLWRQHNRLIEAEKVWETARIHRPGLTAANVCWWYAMGATTDWTVTPRPIYYADGKKDADCYTRPAQLHDELTGELGPFPLFTYWGPTASIISSTWIAHATRRLMATQRPGLTLCYLPHLDYDLQRFGPDGPEAIRAAQEIDAVAGDLIDFARESGYTVVVLSEYGITAVDRPVDINRLLRREGLLEVYTQAGMEYLDPWVSRAFAVADHQLAHVYVQNEKDVPRVRELLEALPGVGEVLGEDGKKEHGLDHPRSGELIAVAQNDSWFTYYYWLDDARAPDFARGVEIHRKPGYDPAELFMDPHDRLVKARAALTLARKFAGLRYAMKVVPLDPAPVRGSHGRSPSDPDDGPVLLCSDPSVSSTFFEATAVRDLMLEVLLRPAR